MTRKIIINADDFGLCEGVNQGIVKAHTEGILTSATLMTNMPCAGKAVELAKLLLLSLFNLIIQSNFCVFIK